jgi:toxin ParE1/3/4
MNLRWDARALNDLESIHEYIARDNFPAAGSVVQRIEGSVSRLENFPFSGRPGGPKGTRILSVPGLPYIVVHRVRGSVVDILAVVHTARRRRG